MFYFCKMFAVTLLSGTAFFFLAGGQPAFALSPSEKPSVANTVPLSATGNTSLFKKKKPAISPKKSEPPAEPAGKSFETGLKSEVKRQEETPVKKTDLKSPVKQKKSSKKKWKLKFRHAISTPSAVGSRSISSHSLTGSYSKKQTFSISSAYTYPLGNVADTSPFGWADTSLGLAGPLPFPKSFFGKKWRGGASLVLPTSKTARIAGKLFSTAVRLKHSLTEKKPYKLTANHIFYSGFYKYRSSPGGFKNNPFASSSHSLNFGYKYKRLSFSAVGRLDLSFSLLKGSGSWFKRLKQDHRQGFKFTLALSFPKLNASLFGQTGVNIPFISPVLTGFPLSEEYWVHLLGFGWGL